MGCPLQGPEAVKKEDVEGDEDDEAGGRGQRSRVGHTHNLKGHDDSPLTEEEVKTQRGGDISRVTQYRSSQVRVLIRSEAHTLNRPPNHLPGRAKGGEQRSCSQR